MSELVGDYRVAATSSRGEINSEVADAAGQDGRDRGALRRRAGSDHLDGVSVDYDDWHFNVRPSNTEPLLRLCLESLVSVRGHGAPARRGPRADPWLSTARSGSSRRPARRGSSSCATASRCRSSRASRSRSSTATPTRALYPIGEEQARRVGERLAAAEHDRRDLRHAAAAHGADRGAAGRADSACEPRVEPDLREVNLGEWENGGLRKHARDGHPLVAQVFAEQRWDVIPGAEPTEAFNARVRAGHRADRRRAPRRDRGRRRPRRRRSAACSRRRPAPAALAVRRRRQRLDLGDRGHRRALGGPPLQRHRPPRRRRRPGRRRRVIAGSTASPSRRRSRSGGSTATCRGRPADAGRHRAELGHVADDARGGAGRARPPRRGPRADRAHPPAHRPHRPGPDPRRPLRRRGLRARRAGAVAGGLRREHGGRRSLRRGDHGPPRDPRGHPLRAARGLGPVPRVGRAARPSPSPLRDGDELAFAGRTVARPPPPRPLAVGHRLPRRGHRRCWSAATT